MDTDVIMIGLGLAALMIGLLTWLIGGHLRAAPGNTAVGRPLAGSRAQPGETGGPAGRPVRGDQRPQRSLINSKATSLGASMPSKGVEILRAVSNEEDPNRLETSPLPPARNMCHERTHARSRQHGLVPAARQRTWTLTLIKCPLARERYGRASQNWRLDNGRAGWSCSISRSWRSRSISSPTGSLIGSSMRRAVVSNTVRCSSSPSSSLSGPLPSG